MMVAWVVQPPSAKREKLFSSATGKKARMPSISGFSWRRIVRRSAASLAAGLAQPKPRMRYSAAFVFNSRRQGIAMLTQAFAYKCWSDRRTLDAVAQIDSGRFPEEYAFALQQLNHMAIVEDLFRARLSGAADPHPARGSSRPR
ncbi:DinB family protein [Pseudomonas sp. DP-17]|uniref:DinB family protein n=1 Tax=Pseudomonas sp. DP-17 TaxID=1580486 RepID=UPI0023BAA6B8|nr:DinB family protein [Pseudomonas sp. DP-17]